MENFVPRKKNFKCYTMVYGGANEENAIYGVMCSDFLERVTIVLQQYFVFFEVELGMNEESQKKKLNYNNQGGRIRRHALNLSLGIRSQVPI